MARPIDSLKSTPVIGDSNSVDTRIPFLYPWQLQTVDRLMRNEAAPRAPWDMPVSPTLKKWLPNQNDGSSPAPTLPWWVDPNPIVPVPNKKDPFGPVPVTPDLNKAPIEVDPPSRPPQWMFGPPQIVNAPSTAPLAAFGGAGSGPDSPSFPSPGSAAPATLYKPGGILGMMIDAGLVDPVNPDQPRAGGVLGPVLGYFRNDPNAGR